MTLAQLAEVARLTFNRRCDYDATWGTSTTGGYYSLWLWCQAQLKGEPTGQLNWLARRKIQAIQDLVPLDDGLTGPLWPL
jgi:hypothetical protein